MTAVPTICGEGRAAGIAAVAASAVGQAVAAGIAAIATRQIFRDLHYGDAGLPVVPLAILFLAGAAIAGLRVWGRVAGEKLGQDYAISLRRALFTQLTLMPASVVANRRNGALALRFVGDLATARNWVGLGIARIISAAIVVPGAAAVLLALNLNLGLAAVAPLAVALAVMLAMAPWIAPLHKRLRRRRAGLAIDMMERVSVAPDLMLMGRDKIELKKLSKRSRELGTAAVGRALGAAALRGLPEIGSAAAAACLLLAAFHGDATPAEAAGALAVLAILAQPMRDLAGVWDHRCAWRIARHKCEILFASPTLEPANVTRTPRPKGPARLVFKHAAKGALLDLDATATPGAKIAISGANGAGKSTCLALAAGLEFADHGRVEIDGVDISALRHRDRQRSVFYIGPRTPILRGSLRRTLTLGIRPRPDDVAIEAVARDFGLADVLARLGGLDGKVSEGGHNLSSGEARRIRLVRAALSQPRLLLLDELDAVLDAKGRDAVRTLVRETTATTLFVTNDPRLIACADIAWHLDRGTIVERTLVNDPSAGDGPTDHTDHPRMIA